MNPGRSNGKCVEGQWRGDRLRAIVLQHTTFLLEWCDSISTDAYLYTVI